MSSAHDLGILLSPRSVVVVSDYLGPGGLAHQLALDVRAGGYRGSLFLAALGGLVGSEPAAQECVDQLSALSVVPELALVAAPRPKVAECVRAVLAHGTRNICIYTSGFGEVDEDGQEEQQRLTTQIRNAGGRLIGPNSFGLMRLSSGLCATSLGIVSAPAGLSERTGISLVSSSGGLARVIHGRLHQRGLPVMTLVGLGNCSDLGASDWLDYLVDDPHTRVAAFVLEGGGTGGRRWLESAARLSRHKPLVIMRSGRTRAGARAIASHTGLSQSPVVLEDLMIQAGLTLAENTNHFVELLEAYWCMGDRLPVGSGVAIVSTSGGAAAVAADTAELAGLEIPPLDDPAVAARIEAELPEGGSRLNPVDVTPDYPPEHWGPLLEAVFASGDVSSVCLINTCFDQPDLAALASALSQETGKPLTVCTESGSSFAQTSRKLGLPDADTVEGAMKMLIGLHQRAEAVSSPGLSLRPAPRRGSRVLEEEFRISSQRVPAAVVLGSRGGLHRRTLDSSRESKLGLHSLVVPEEICRRVLREYEFTLLEETELRALADIRWYAQKKGFPVILKIQPGGQIARVANERELADTLQMLEAEPEELHVTMVEPRPQGGRISFLGLNHPDFGALTALRTFRETVWHFCPPTESMVLRTLRRLDLGPASAGLDAVERMSTLLTANPALNRVELDVVLTITGAVVSTYRMVVSRPD